MRAEAIGNVSGYLFAQERGEALRGLLRLGVVAVAQRGQRLL